MDFRPASLKTIIAFRENPFTIKLRYPDGYTVPNDIRAEFRSDRRREDVGIPEITILGSLATILFPSSLVRLLPSFVDLYILSSGVTKFSAKILVKMGAGTPGSGEYLINILEEDLVEVPVYSSEFEYLQSELTTAVERIDNLEDSPLG